MKMPPRIEFITNPKYLEPWALAIGKLMINFALIELQSINWIDALTQTDFATYDREIKEVLNKRIQWIRTRIESSSLSTKLKQAAPMAWDPVVTKRVGVRNLAEV